MGHHHANSSHSHPERGGRWGLIREEFTCHLPYAVFSVAAALAVLGFVTQSSPIDVATGAVHERADTLFHCFHFMHLLFAVTGALVTFLRYSRNFALGILVGIVSPAIFCMFSDVIFPCLAGNMLGVDMHFHICFVSELPNVLPFILVGAINGYVLGKYHQHEHRLFHSLLSHVMHIFVSSLASAFYLVAHGFVNYLDHIGAVFLFLVVAVVVPCTLSDMVVPMIFARSGGHDEEHSS